MANKTLLIHGIEMQRHGQHCYSHSTWKGKPMQRKTTAQCKTQTQGKLRLISWVLLICFSFISVYLVQS